MSGVRLGWQDRIHQGRNAINWVQNIRNSIAELMGPRGGQHRWGLKDSHGNDALLFASFISCEVRNEGQIVSAPVEEGSFASYNKVAKPISVLLSISMQGDDAYLQASLDQLQRLKTGLEMLIVVTPNEEYSNLNLESYSYRRAIDQGLGVVYADLVLNEVRQVRRQYSNSRLAPRQRRGKVQAKETSWASHIGSWFSGD